jgi:hypothetical protein
MACYRNSFALAFYPYATYYSYYRVEIENISQFLFHEYIQNILSMKEAGSS